MLQGAWRRENRKPASSLCESKSRRSCARSPWQVLCGSCCKRSLCKAICTRCLQEISAQDLCTRSENKIAVQAVYKRSLSSLPRCLFSSPGLHARSLKEGLLAKSLYKISVSGICTKISAIELYARPLCKIQVTWQERGRSLGKIYVRNLLADPFARSLCKICIRGLLARSLPMLSIRALLARPLKEASWPDLCTRCLLVKSLCTRWALRRN